MLNLMITPMLRRSGLRAFVSRSLSYRALLSLLLISILVACQPATAHIRVHNQGFELNGEPYHLLGVNYYPQKTPWSLFWQNFDPDIVEQDFILIRELGLNTIRIFVPYQQFGGPQVQAEFKAKLLQLLNLAQGQELHVVVTLFDFFQDYTQLGDAQEHVRTLVQGLEAHPAILAWDLKNEGDLDYAQNTQRVVDWVQSMAQTLRSVPVQQLITAGWSKSETVPDIATHLDYLTFHDYRPERAFPERLQRLQAQSAKPVVLGEFGYHTWAQSPQDPHSLAAQFNYFQVMMFTVLERQVAGAMAWTLYDFDPQLREDWVLQQTSVQHFLGLLDAQGQAKPGLEALKQHVYLRDAESQGAVSLNTRQIEMAFRAAASGQAQLRRYAGEKLLDTQIIDVQPGVNIHRWTLTESEVRDLIYLKQRYELQADSLSSAIGTPLEQQRFPLQLRRD